MIDPIPADIRPWFDKAWSAFSGRSPYRSTVVEFLRHNGLNDERIIAGVLRWFGYWVD